MRRGHSDPERENVSRDVLQIDFHEFVRLAPLMTDTELANEFHFDPKQAELLRAQLRRS